MLIISNQHIFVVYSMYDILVIFAHYPRCLPRFPYIKIIDIHVYTINLLLSVFIVFCVGGSKAKSVLYFPSTCSTVMVQITVNRIHESARASCKRNYYLKRFLNFVRQSKGT